MVASISHPLRLFLAFFCCSLVQDCLQAEVASEETVPARPGWYMGRRIAPMMSADGAEWLIRKSRDREEQPQLLLDALQLQQGQTICDFGCGNGFYTVPLAHRVGPRGKVIALDIQQEMLTLLQQRIESRGIKNVQAVLATEHDSGLAPNTLDLVLMVDVYHELPNPPRVLSEVKKGLKKDGMLVLVEFREEDPNVPIRPLHKMSQGQIAKELRANDFKLVHQFDGLPWQHVMYFARRNASLEARKVVPWSPRNAQNKRVSAPKSRVQSKSFNLPPQAVP